MIPRIIHKIWFDFGEGKVPPKKYLEQEQHCLKLNNGWTLMRWNEENSDEFMRHNFPSFYKKWKHYEYPIQKVDSLRYFLLFFYGGVYMDMDIKCLRVFDVFTEDKVYLIEDVNVLNSSKFNNCLMASPKGHDFWKHVIETMKKNYRKMRYIRSLHILYSTGPHMVEESYDGYEDKSQIVILPKELFNPCDICGICNNSPNVYIVHQGDAKWATNKLEELCIYLFCHKKTCLGVVAILTLLFLLGVFSYKILKG